ncbi:hypothetical protein DMUE_2057 [Dictyocoela muelleri]|nr:hypothetical protein DMUE_2057 [Dictyocoela muelleri]
MKEKKYVTKEDDILECIKKTFSTEVFLIFDSGIHSENRILIFSTATHLLYFENSDEWYYDSTFKSCPDRYEQLYKIMRKIKSNTLPLLYILMKNRSKVNYLKAFNYIKRNITKTPKFIKIDFEMAAFSALKDVFVHS